MQRLSQPLHLNFVSIRWSPFWHSNAFLLDTTKWANGERYLNCITSYVLSLFLTTADKPLFYNEAGHLANTTVLTSVTKFIEVIVKAKQLLRPGKSCS